MYSWRFMRFDVSNYPALSSLGINFEDCCSSLRKSWRRRSSSRCSGAFPTWIRRNSIANCGLVVWVGSIHAMAKFYGTNGLWSSYNIIPDHELGNSWIVGERVPKWEVAGGKGSGLRGYMDLKTTIGWVTKVGPYLSETDLANQLQYRSSIAMLLTLVWPTGSSLIPRGRSQWPSPPGTPSRRWILHVCQSCQQCAHWVRRTPTPSCIGGPCQSLRPLRFNAFPWFFQEFIQYFPPCGESTGDRSADAFWQRGEACHSDVLGLVGRSSWGPSTVKFVSWMKTKFSKIDNYHWSLAFG